MVVPNNHGFFLLKMIILGCFRGTTIYGNTHIITCTIWAILEWLSVERVATCPFRTTKLMQIWISSPGVLVQQKPKEVRWSNHNEILQNDNMVVSTWHGIIFSFYLTVKVHVLSKATSFSVLYKAPLFCFMSFHEILLVVFYTRWTGLVDLSNLLHFLRAQHSDVSRGKNRPAKTSLCTCCFHCNALIFALCYAIRWTSLRQIADSALRSTQRAPVPGIPVLGHFGSRDVMNMLHLRYHNLIYIYILFFSRKTEWT